MSQPVLKYFFLAPENYFTNFPFVFSETFRHESLSSQNENIFHACPPAFVQPYDEAVRLLCLMQVRNNVRTVTHNFRPKQDDTHLTKLVIKENLLSIVYYNLCLGI